MTGHSVNSAVMWKVTVDGQCGVYVLYVTIHIHVSIHICVRRAQDQTTDEDIKTP